MSAQDKGGKPGQTIAVQIAERLKRMQKIREMASEHATKKARSLRSKTLKDIIPARAVAAFQNTFFSDEVEKEIKELLSASETEKDKLARRIGREFLKTAEGGNPHQLAAFIEHGFPVDYQDPQTGETALHIVAACQARKALRVLLKSEECDFLLRDNQGRLPSEMAYLYGRDPAVARLLGIKERKQAEEAGIKLTRRPKAEN